MAVADIFYSVPSFFVIFFIKNGIIYISTNEKAGVNVIMDKWKKRSVDLFTSLVFGSDDGTSVVPYYPQKTELGSREERFFKRTVPERQGVSSKRIYNMLCELESEKRANVHSLMILRGGEVICECSREGYGVNTLHVSHSMSKSVCGMVIGRLWEDGKVRLDDRIVDILPDVRYKDKRFALITVEHLLTMTCGVDFAELGSITDRGWTEAFFASTIKFPPGNRFLYNSMNTYILARIAEKITSVPFINLVRDWVFSPLEITNYFWEKGPEGTEKAGWGLYLSAESWAKLGYMFLSGGTFFGNKVLSERWIEKCSSTKAVAPEESGDFDYTYQMWKARRSDELLFNGMLGQNVWISPQNNIVAVLTGGNNELFTDSPALNIVRKHLGGVINDDLYTSDVGVLIEKTEEFFDPRRYVVPKEKNTGLLYRLGIISSDPFDTDWLAVLGRYAISKNNHGILPLIVRAMQNNLDSTIQQISIERRKNELYMLIHESNETHRIPIGIYGYKSCVLTFRGEKYLAKAVGRSMTDSNGERKYQIEIIFPELSSTRMIEIKRLGDMITIALSESPNNRIIDTYLERMSSSSSALSIVFKLLERKFGNDFISQTINKTFNPVLVGADMQYSGYKLIIEEQNKKVDDELDSVRLIRVVVDRFFKESPTENCD